LKQLAKFVNSGGTLISYGAIPSHREDAGPADEFAELVKNLWENTNRHHGKVIHVDTLDALGGTVSHLDDPDLSVSPRTRDVYYQHRALPTGDIYFLLNNATTATSGEFTFRASGSVQICNPMNGEIKPSESTQHGASTTVNLTLPPRNGLFVVFERG
jgi:hypothetical protein